MQGTKYFILLFLSLSITNLFASDKESIAVLEFRNKSKAAVRFSGSEMAAWMSHDLKEHDRFDPFDRKAVAKIVKNAKWLDDHLSSEDESKLLAIPVQYALYGSIANWHSSIDATSTGVGISPRMATKQAIPGVLVILHFDLVDLSTGKTIKSFETEGSGQAAIRGTGEPEGSAQAEIADFDRTFEEACRTAIRKAANMLSND